MVLTLGASFGCGSTTDSLGDTKQPTVVLKPLQKVTPPNVFKEALGKGDTEINKKVELAFQQLFHGDPDEQAIFVYDAAGNYADIHDVLHDDYRSEGYGLAMLIAVELGKRSEFDNLWRGALRHRSTNPSSKAYFDSKCDTGSTTVNGVTYYTTEDCLDPFALQQFVTALLFANDTWKDAAPTIDYGAAASELLYSLRHVEDTNGGIVDGITNTFDANKKLVFHVPNVSARTFTRPSLEIPAYYELWGQATGDSFYHEAAEAGRAYIELVANEDTGLTPARASFDGTPIARYDTFRAESYRVQLNLMLDALWTQETDAVLHANRILTFFSAQQVKNQGTYGGEYSLDGATMISSMQQGALIAANGMSAARTAVSDRKDYVSAVWDLALSTGKPRYFSGLMHLLALLALSGKLQVL